jgi:hypothetical protein
MRCGLNCDSGASQTSGHRRLERRRDDLYAGGLHKRAMEMAFLFLNRRQNPVVDVEIATAIVNPLLADAARCGCPVNFIGFAPRAVAIRSIHPDPHFAVLNRVLFSAIRCNPLRRPISRIGRIGNRCLFCGIVLADPANHNDC